MKAATHKQVHAVWVSLSRKLNANSCTVTGHNLTVAPVAVGQVLRVEGHTWGGLQKGLRKHVRVMGIFTILTLMIFHVNKYM